MYTRIETLPGEPEPFDTEPVEQYEVNTDAPPPPRPWRTKLRRMFMPFPVAGLLWASADAANSLPLDGVAGALADVTPAAVYFVAAMGYWRQWADQQPETTRRERRRWATTVIAGGTGWLLWGATFGPATFADIVLVAGGSALMIPYWDRNSPWQRKHAKPENDDTDLVHEELPDTPDVPEMDVVTVTDRLTPTQLFWDSAVADRLSALRGTYLTDPLITDEYEQYTIQLQSATQTTGGAQAAATNVASAFGRSLDTIVVLPYPTGDQDKAVLRLTKANPLQGTRTYPGAAQAIDLTDGNIRGLIGHRGNGSSVWWEFFKAGWGLRGGAVFGDSGAGKSELLISIITSAAYSGRLVPIVACPQGGASFPMWMEHGHWPAPSGDEILHQARGLLKAHQMRSLLNKLRGDQFHTPTELEPGYPWIVDEIHKIKEHEAAAEIYMILDILAREGRKTAIRPIVADQDPSVPATFFNLMSLRNNAISGNCVTLRLGSNADSMLKGMKLNPCTLPELFPDGSPTAGLGIILGESEPFRVDRVMNAWDLAKEAPQRTIDAAIAGSMGEHYALRHQRGLADAAEAAAQIELHDPKLIETLLATKPELAAALEKLKTELARAAAAPPIPAAPSRSTTTVLVLGVPAVPQLELVPAKSVQDKQAWTCMDRVEEALRQGVTQFGEIHKYAIKPSGEQYKETAVRNALKQLVAEGRCRDGGYQRWEYITPAA